MNILSCLRALFCFLAYVIFYNFVSNHLYWQQEEAILTVVTFMLYVRFRLSTNDHSPYNGNGKFIFGGRFYENRTKQIPWVIAVHGTGVDAAARHFP